MYLNRYAFRQCPRCKDGDLYTYDFKKVPYSCVQCGHQFELHHGKFEALRKELQVSDERSTDISRIMELISAQDVL